MELLEPEEFHRRFLHARRERARELEGLGASKPEARHQAAREFEIYDLLVTDEEGRMAYEGLDLPPVPGRRPTR